MRLDVREDPSICGNVQVYDKVTGEPIPYVIAGDDAIGQIIRYDLDPNRKPYIKDGDVVIISEIREFEFVRI